jgi:hypothetical protein
MMFGDGHACKETDKLFHGYGKTIRLMGLRVQYIFVTKHKTI